MKYKIGLVIGRFQPFHNGHLYLLKKALKSAESLIIGIGSSNVQNAENIFDFKMRKKMIETVFEKEGLQNRLIKIVGIPDMPNDDKWLQIVQKQIGKFDVSIGNNEWVNGIFEKADIPVLRVPYYKREKYEGTKIRKAIREGKRLENFMPDYLLKYH